MASAQPRDTSTGTMIQAPPPVSHAKFMASMGSPATLPRIVAFEVVANRSSDLELHAATAHGQVLRLVLSRAAVLQLVEGLADRAP